MRPGDGRVRFGLKGDLVGCTVALAYDDDARPRRQFGEPPPDGGESSLVGDQQMPIVCGRDDEGAARAADRQRLAGLRLLGPTRRWPGVVNGEVDRKRIVGRVITARGEIASQHVGRAFGVAGAVGEEQFYVVVEAE